jgi:hypothetical protein
MTLKSATEHIQKNGNLFNGLYKQFTYSFSESNPQSSSEYDSAEEECPQLVDFPSFFPVPSNQFLAVTNPYIKRKYLDYDVCILTAI